MDLIPEITKSPDITSIITAFEQKRNPLELFTSSIENSELTNKITAINTKIDELIHYITDTKLVLKPHEHNLHKSHLKLLQDKLSNVNLNVKTFDTTCRQCNTNFNLHNLDDLDNLLNHEHAVTALVNKQPNNKNDIIQQISRKINHFRCLACRVLITGMKSVYFHLKSKSHANKINNPEIWASVQDYFTIFDNLPEEYRVFEVIFEPCDYECLSYVFCTVCGIYIMNIPQHLTDEKHLHRFLTNDYSFLNGYADMLKICGCEKSEVMCAQQQVKIKPEKPRKKLKTKHDVVPAYTLCHNGGKSFHNFIPNRFKNQAKFITGDVQYPFCTLCYLPLKDIMDIVPHFSSDEHRARCRDLNIETSNYCYYCCVCSKHFKKEFKWIAHVTSVGHRQKECSLMTKDGGSPVLEEFECNSCLWVWFGHPNSVSAHERNKFGPNESRGKKKEVTLSNEITKLLKDEVAFAADINKAIKESNDVLCSIQSAYKCCQAIEAALASTFGDQIRAYPFGSRVSGLGNIASDLDVFVDIGSMYEGTINQNAQFQSYCVQQTAAALRRHKDFTDICPIPQARTPIVQVFHKLTDLDCDLSFRHGLSIENTQFLKFCINIQPKLRSLILFLKKWIRLNKFRDRISTYGISLMSIYMMQNKNYMPSLATLRKIDPQHSKIIAGWETFNFRKPLSHIQILYPPYQKNERYLLIEFFDFYINFDFKNDVVCPLLGQPVQKTLFQIDNVKNDEILLPLEMASYVNKIKEDENNERIKITKSICIQDPFDLSHNVTKALPVEVFLKMITLMKQSHLLLLKP